MGVGGRLKQLDFYRKIPRDLSEATWPGASISLVAAFVIVFLFLCELNAYMTTTTRTEVVVDRSEDGDLLRINFNVSFPALSCEFASVDVNDVMGMHRINLTKTVWKRPLDRSGRIIRGVLVDDRPDIKHEELPAVPAEKDGVDEDGKEEADAADEEPALGSGPTQLNRKTLPEEMKKWGILLVNFYAPWCPWSRRLAPVWESAAQVVHGNHNKDGNRIHLGQVDCTLEPDLCRHHHIQGFPSVRIFRGGSDVVQHGEHHDHSSYVGDRTVEAISKFAESLLPSEEHVQMHGNKPHALPAHAKAQIAPAGGHTPGCNIEGFVLVKKVPGTMYVTAHSSSHSFARENINMTHIVNEFRYGRAVTMRKLKTLKRLHPGGLTPNWSDKLVGDTYVSNRPNTTFEHYMQVVLTTVEPLSGGLSAKVDAYEYTQHSHSFEAHGVPQARFSFHPSPMQIVVSEEPLYGFYHFITTVCAIIGGVYSVAGICDGMLHNTLSLLRKNELGKMS